MQRLFAHNGENVKIKFTLSGLGDLKTLQFYGYGALKKIDGNDEKLPFQIRFDHESLDALERTIDDFGAFTDLGILELLNFDLRTDDSLNSFNLIIRYGNWFMTMGFAKDANDAESLKDFQFGFIVEVHQFHEDITGKHGDKYLLATVFPLAPDLDLGQKSV